MISPTSLREIARTAALWIAACLLALCLWGSEPVCGVQPPDGVVPSSVLPASEIVVPSDARKLTRNADGSFQCNGLGMTECYEEMTRFLRYEADYHARALEIRQVRAYRANLLCGALDLATMISSIEDGATEANPILGPLVNRDDDTERYLGYAAILGLKYGLARLARATPSTADDWILAGSGCSAAGWNGYQMLEAE